jgi:YbbR domain-containing protein
MVLYLYVQIIDPTPTEEVHLLVRARNLAPGLVFDAEGTPVTFEATGPKDVLNRLQSRLKDNPSFVVATADLKQFSLNRVHEKVPVIPVVLTVRPPPEFDSITFSQPYQLDGAVERQKSSDVKIRVKFANSTSSPADDGADPSDFEVTPPVLTLTGSETDVDKADPFVVIDPQEVKRDGIEEVPLNLSAKLVSRPNVDRVEVRAVRRQRAAFVNVIWLGHLAAGYTMSNYYVVSGPSTSSVYIEGPAGVVDKTAKIDADIDISGLTESFTYQPEPKMDSRLRLVDSPLQIHVDIKKTRR